MLTARPPPATFDVFIRTKMSIETTIRKHVQSALLDGSDRPDDWPGRDEDLLTLLDSLQVLRMLLDLEAEYAIKVDNSELMPENLGTVGRLADFVAKKIQAAPLQGQPS